MYRSNSILYFVSLNLILILQGCAGTPFVDLPPEEKLEAVYGDMPGVSYAMKTPVFMVSKTDHSIEVVNNSFDAVITARFSSAVEAEKIVRSRLSGGIVGGGIYHHKITVPEIFKRGGPFQMVLITPISKVERDDGSSTVEEMVSIFELNGANFY